MRTKAVYTAYMQNITLSAPKPDIEQARLRFKRQGTTLNAEFRKWITADDTISSKVSPKDLQKVTKFREMMKTMPKMHIGYKITRDEMNAR